VISLGNFLAKFGENLRSSSGTTLTIRIVASTEEEEEKKKLFLEVSNY
jgi:hypothetical protein